jgi:DNA-binding response OmpR family regulator
MLFKNWFKSLPLPIDDSPESSALLISDDFDRATSICDLFEADGYKSYLTSGVNDTLHMLDNIPTPGVIICDLKRPMIEGKEIIHRIRTRFGKTSLPPLVFLYDAADDEWAARDLGADELLLKSSDLQELVRRIYLLMFEKTP